MSLFKSIARIIEASTEIVDKTVVEPVADAVELVAEPFRKDDA